MGERRLARLAEAFDLKVERSFLEIHPETPPEGRPIESLGYPPERWAQLTANIARMGKEEDITFIDRTFTTNSHKALLLAEAARESDPGVFEALNEALFLAYFSDGKNIGNETVLRRIAEEAGVPGETVDLAWSDPRFEERLKRQHEVAARVGVTGIPTFILGNKWIIEGAVPTEMLKDVALKVAAAS
ncbi:MAG: DsbA family protein [Deltaproteobacteria bacterium]|nr:DsbA family protein [Deltaproteobacteria bacterium]PWB65777.1 MAG: DsbA family protein [Deltaproteobacteria bacterium]